MLRCSLVSQVLRRLLGTPFGWPTGRNYSRTNYFGLWQKVKIAFNIYVFINKKIKMFHYLIKNLHGCLKGTYLLSSFN